MPYHQPPPKSVTLPEPLRKKTPTAEQLSTLKELSREHGPVFQRTQNTKASWVVSDTVCAVSIIGIGIWVLVVGLATTQVDVFGGLVSGVDSFSASIPVNAAPLRFASSLVNPLVATYVLISLSALVRMCVYKYQVKKAETERQLVQAKKKAETDRQVVPSTHKFDDEEYEREDVTLSHTESRPTQSPPYAKLIPICTAVVLVAVHLALVLAWIDWGDDASGTPVRLLLMGGVVYAANEVTVRIFSEEKFTINSSLMTVRHMLHATAFAVALVAFEWIPVFERSTGLESLPVTDFCDDMREQPRVMVSSWIFMDGFQGAWTQYAPSSAAAVVVTVLVASSEILGVVRLFRVTEWGEIPVDFWYKSELWARYTVVAAIAMVAVFELYAHSARMQHDPLQSNGRECASFMQRSLRYFAGSGIKLEDDCASSPVYPVHCAGCLHGGFGVATLGEDITSSAKVTTVFAVWLVVDGALALAGCVNEMRK